MVITLRRASLSLIAAAALAVVTAVPSLAQVSPAAPRVGPAMGTPTTTAPSNSEGTPAGGTGVLSQSQVGGGGYQADPAASAAPRQSARRARNARRARARAARRAARRGTGAASSSGLNGSNGPSN